MEGHEESRAVDADSASQGTIGADPLSVRPILRTGELLEAVPGVIVTQHAGGGKANQYFLRGFNLDHGTDFATSIDGVPVNLPTHGHGQGYTDLNFVIPELVERVDYQKGLYFAGNGDFASAGAAHLQTYNVLPQGIAVLEGGMFGYARGVFAASPRLGEGHLLYGFEAYHDDGPWRRPDDFQRFNGVLRYSRGDDSSGASVTARGYHGQWNSSDQVAQSAVEPGLISRYGSLDPTTGGDSQRYSLQAEWHRADDRSATQVMTYGLYYDLDLFSDFTYRLVDPVLGDQFEQADRRYVAGLDARHTLFGQWRGRDLENTFGLQVRNDVIENGLYQTVDRVRTAKFDVPDGGVVLPAVTREDHVLESSVGVYYENKVQWTDRFRTVAGVRGDVYRFGVDSSRAENSGERVAATGSPKLSLVFGPWSRTEVYVQGGMGFHSNDGRGITTRVDPVTGTPLSLGGDAVRQADPLVKTYGAELGVRTEVVPGIRSTLAFWWLDMDSELVFAGDAGTTEASRPSRRYGIEWANAWQMDREWSVEAEACFSRAAFRDFDPAGDHIPGAIETVVSGGVLYRNDAGFRSALRLRYFGPRPLIEDNSLRSNETLLLSAEAAYSLNKTWTLVVEAFNLLNRRDHDIDYAYESRVLAAGLPATQIHFHPVEPVQVRLALTARF